MAHNVHILIKHRGVDFDDPGSGYKEEDKDSVKVGMKFVLGTLL